MLSGTDTLIATPLGLRRYASFRRITAVRLPKERRQYDASREKVANLFGLTADAAVADFEDFNLLEPRRRANFHDVALMRLH